MTQETARVAGVELGGTKCVCVLGSGPDDIADQVRIPTTKPAETLAAIADVLRGWEALPGGFSALGIASFGPLDLRESSPTYGRVRSAVKPGWRNADVYAALRAGRSLPVGFDTDVNGAALAEGRWGAAQGLTDYAYVTVGTGIGVGVVVGGRVVHGCHHPELGHIRIARREGDFWPGACTYHGDCVEGLAAGPAIEARTGIAAALLPADDPAWEVIAHALGQLLHTLVFTTGPQRILMGGGVPVGRPELIDRVRRELLASIAGYIDLVGLVGGLDRYVSLRT